MRTCVLALLWAACGSETAIRADFEVVDPVDVLPCEFTPLSASRLSVYDCNPVFTSVDEPWADGVQSVAFRTQYVMGHPVFQVWYTSALAVPDQRWGLGHAISADGITWTPHRDNPLYSPADGWDRAAASAVNVAYNADEEEYALTYQGQDLSELSLGVGALKSPNGVVWDPSGESSRIIDLSASSNVCWPLGMSWSPTRGYYGFVAFQRGGTACEPYRFEADELAANAFEVDENAAFEADRGFDAEGVLSTATVELDGMFYMFYVGFRTWDPSKVPGFVVAANTELGLATSTDGITWTRVEGENPLPVRLTDPGEVSAVGAQAIGGRIHVWVTDVYPDLGDRGVGYYVYDPAIELHP